jgi:hypothetical protein
VSSDPFADYEGKLEPDCTTCDDQGTVPDLTGETGVANCPDCNPTPEQVAATTAELRRRVEAGEYDPTAAPFRSAVRQLLIYPLSERPPMRRSLVLIILAVCAVTGCSSTPSTADTTTTVSPTASTKAPLTPEEYESLMAGAKDKSPAAPDQEHRAGYLAALEKVNPELVEDRDPDALVNRGIDQCRDLKERPKGQWLTWVKTRFSSPEHPDGFDDATSAKVLAVVRKYICPSF